MSQPAGAVQNGLVMRLSVPASGAMSDVGPALATRLAEQLGVPSDVAARAGASVTDLVAALPAPGDDVELEFHKLPAELKIVVCQAGRTSEARVPLAS